MQVDKKCAFYSVEEILLPTGFQCATKSTEQRDSSLEHILGVQMVKVSKCLILTPSPILL